jgi:hypothetical protein
MITVDLQQPAAVPPTRGTPAARPLSQPAMIVILVAVAGALYLSSLHGPFVFDDRPNILENHHIRIKHLSPANLLAAGLESPIPSRPVANISFALNYYLHGYWPAGYRAVNIALHLATGILLFFFLKTILPACELKMTAAATAAFFAALLWLVHPVNTQAVNYIVQRMTVLAAFFYLLSLYLYTAARRTEIRRRKKYLYTGCAVAGLLAMGSKEIAVTLPFFIFLYEWFFFRNLDPAWLKRRLPLLVGLAALLAPLAVWYINAHSVGGAGLLAQYDRQAYTPVQRLLTEFRVIVYYISLLAFPHPGRLNLDYDFALSKSLLDPVTTLPAAAAVLGLAVLAIGLTRRHRLVAYGLFWFLGNLAIESSLIPLDIVFEHRLYLPSMLPVLLVVLAAQAITKPPWLKTAGLCTLAAVLAIWTTDRNAVWSDRIRLWQDTAAKAPRSARVQNNLGLAYYDSGNLAEALVHYRRALELKPADADAHNNMGTVYATRGDYGEAERHFREAVRLNPDYYVAYTNLGVLLLIQNRIDPAEHYLFTALRLEPGYVYALNALGVSRNRQGHREEAADYFRRALALEPHYGEARRNLDSILAGSAEE